MRLWQKGIACTFVVLMLHSGSATGARQGDRTTDRPVAHRLGARIRIQRVLLRRRVPAVRGYGADGDSRSRRFAGDTIRALCKIVAKGADAVPVLLKHIGDTRTIKMKPVRGMMWMDFPDEYDFNHRTRKIPPKGVNRDSLGSGRDQPTEHAITVGDLCFVALGQIVNRHFSATRYQPTGGLIVNSPTYSKASVRSHSPRLERADQATAQRLID